MSVSHTLQLKFHIIVYASKKAYVHILCFSIASEIHNLLCTEKNNQEYINHTITRKVDQSQGAKFTTSLQIIDFIYIHDKKLIGHLGPANQRNWI